MKKIFFLIMLLSIPSASFAQNPYAQNPYVLDFSGLNQGLSSLAGAIGRRKAEEQYRKALEDYKKELDAAEQEKIDWNIYEQSVDTLNFLTPSEKFMRKAKTFEKVYNDLRYDAFDYILHNLTYQANHLEKESP